MGILEEIHAEAMNVILEDGDMIIMVTDGIIDSVDLRIGIRMNGLPVQS